MGIPLLVRQYFYIEKPPCSKPSLWKTRTSLAKILDTMAADELVMQGVNYGTSLMSTEVKIDSILPNSSVLWKTFINHHLERSSICWIKSQIDFLQLVVSLFGYITSFLEWNWEWKPAFQEALITGCGGMLLSQNHLQELYFTPCGQNGRHFGRWHVQTYLLGRKW